MIGISRLSEVTITDERIPNGWVVRERTFKDVKNSVLDYGCYLAPGVFLSVPMHFSFKKHLIPINSYKTDDTSYYAVPNDMEVAVSVFTTKKGDVRPILIHPNDEHPAVFISSLAINCEAESIINATISENTTIIRRFIDRNRKYFGVIAFNSDTGLVNPSIQVQVKKGIVKNSNIVDTTDYNFTTGGVTTVTNTQTLSNPVEVEFIKIPQSFVTTLPTNNRNIKNDNKKRYVKNDNNHTTNN